MLQSRQSSNSIKIKTAALLAFIAHFQRKYDKSSSPFSGLGDSATDQRIVYEQITIHIIAAQPRSDSNFRTNAL